MLIAIAVIGAGLAATGEIWSQSSQREKERELLFVGSQYRKAIMLYYENTPGAAKRYPRSLEDLLKDDRYPFTRRYLRRIYRDPVTNRMEWGIIRAPDGGIMGVYSLSNEAPIKTSGFSARDRKLEGKAQYTEWRFVYEPLPVKPPVVVPGKSPPISGAQLPALQPIAPAPKTPTVRSP